MNFGRRGGIARSVPAAVAERSELSGSPLQSGADEARIGSFWGSMSVIGMFRQQLGSYIKLAVPDEGDRHEILRRCDESHRQRPKPASESTSSQ
jgi:hypothetical protein